MPMDDHLRNYPDVRSAFDSWVNEYTNAMIGFALRYIKDVDQCMDIVQDSFLAAYNSIHTYDNSRNPKTWLFTILRNKCIDNIRKDKIRAKYANDIQEEFDTDGQWTSAGLNYSWDVEDINLLDDPNFIATFHECIQNLPRSMSSVISLRYIDNSDSEKICEELSITKSNYWQMVHRAKMRLRKCLNINWFDRGEQK